MILESGLIWIIPITLLLVGIPLVVFRFHSEEPFGIASLLPMLPGLIVFIVVIGVMLSVLPDLLEGFNPGVIVQEDNPIPNQTVELYNPIPIASNYSTSLDDEDLLGTNNLNLEDI